MKKRFRYGLAALVLGAGVFLAGPAGAAGWVDDWIAQHTSSDGHYFQGQKRGFYQAGSFNTRWQNTSDFLVTVEPPRYKSGCGGVDIFKGGVSFLDFEYLVEKLQRILMSGGAVAFDLALNTLCEPCSTTIKSFEGLVNQLNGLQLDDCAASRKIRAVVEEGDFSSTEAAQMTMTTAVKESELGQGISSLFHKITERHESNDNKPQPAEISRTVAGCHADLKNAFLSGSGGMLLENIGVARLGLQESYVDLIRGILGDIGTEGPDSAFKVTYTPPCPQNKPEEIRSLLDGKVWAQPAAGGPAACYQITDANGDLVAYVRSRLTGIAARMRATSSAFTPAETAFIDNCPLPVHLILKSAIGTDQEGSAIAILAEITAKAYALEMISDLYKRAWFIQQKSGELLAKKASAPPASGAESCQPALFAAGLEQRLGRMLARTEELQEAAKSSYVAAAQEMNEIMQVVAHFRATEQELYRQVSKRFGAGLSARILR